MVARRKQRLLHASHLFAWHRAEKVERVLATGGTSIGRRAGVAALVAAVVPQQFGCVCTQAHVGPWNQALKREVIS
eukprot:scaffold42176_cov71-Phaeocystis_antarctica.AAC.3